MYKKIELLANVAIVIVALVVGVVFVRQRLLAAPTAAPVKPIGAGAKVPLAGIDWERNSQTMLLVLAPGCHYCAESAPFYRRLVEQSRARAQVKILAVFPQGNGDGKKYLQELGVPIEEVKSASLESIGIAGTPTLILVNSEGVVTDVWLGQLTADKETEVLGRL